MRTYMNKTPARIQFKMHFGQANHYLVTTTIALYHLNGSPLIAAPPELHRAWNPQDKASSIDRSRIFILHSFLGWAVDSIDMYLSLLNRKPNYLQNASLSSKMDGAGRSVLKKVEAFGEHYQLHPATLALVDVLITWRNNVFHELADNQIRQSSLDSLSKYATYIEENYRGLVTGDLHEKAHRGGPLTFKETASLINATHNFVQEVDTAILIAFDPIIFCNEAVQDAIDDKKQESGFTAKYFSLTMDARRRFIRNWLLNKYGFNVSIDDVPNQCLLLHRAVDAG
jgi:hypothetical protein